MIDTTERPAARTCSAEPDWLDGDDGLQLNIRQLRRIASMLGVSWPCSIRWMTSTEMSAKDSTSPDGKVCGGYRQASTTRDHTIVLRSGLPVDVAQHVLIHELVHCAQLEQHGNDFERRYLTQMDRFENEAERHAKALSSQVCIVREVV